MPDNQAFANLVDLDGKGYIVAGENCLTDRAGIFTAGDCRTKKVRQLTTAVADGAVAALAAAEYMQREG
jgi:thioredoxin reductase (NADPH)